MNSSRTTGAKSKALLPAPSPPVLPALSAEGAEGPIQEEIQRLGPDLAKALDLVVLGSTLVEAAKATGLSPRRVGEAVRSRVGTEYIALQVADARRWMQGLLLQAAAVFKTELAGKDRLRAADMIFKHLGGIMNVGEQASNKVDATAVARELIRAAGININIDINPGERQPAIKVVNPAQEEKDALD